MLFSILFLVITFLVYLCIPKLRNIHGKCLMCYTLSLMFLFGSLSVVQMDLFDLRIDHVNCEAVGYALYLSIMMSFFWMNVMSYDIWNIARWVKINGKSPKSHTVLLVIRILSITSKSWCPHFVVVRFMAKWRKSLTFLLSQV